MRTIGVPPCEYLKMGNTSCCQSEAGVKGWQHDGRKHRIFLLPKYSMQLCTNDMSNCISLIQRSTVVLPGTGKFAEICMVLPTKQDQNDGGDPRMEIGADRSCL